MGCPWAKLLSALAPVGPRQCGTQNSENAGPIFSVRNSKELLCNVMAIFPFTQHWPSHGSPTRYAKLRVGHAPGMPVTFSPPPLKPLVNYPGMHHGTYGTAIWQKVHGACCQIAATNVPWCMPGSLTRGGGENVPGIPAKTQICSAKNCGEGG